MAATTDASSAKTAEFQQKLSALKALRAELTPERIACALTKFQNTVRDQQRCSELCDVQEITAEESRIIMAQATISSEAHGNDDSIDEAQIWDRAEVLCRLLKGTDTSTDPRDTRDISLIANAIENGHEPVMLNDRASILASTMLTAMNSGKIG